MAKLTDTQSIVLAHAAKNDDGSIYPLPAAVCENGTPSERAQKAIDQLLSRGLVSERETNAAAQISRTDGDLSYGMFITSIGLLAIGVDDGTGDETRASPGAPTPAPARRTKSGAVLALLQRADGATLAELIDATGWLPHTTRAALTGLRKKGHAIEKSKRGDITCYKVAA
jgi:Protein of unknown function (DUF3489)